MQYLKKYKSYNDDRINEEFIGSLIKGALGKLFGAFSAPWKDFVNDFKNAFKEDDPNSIKGIIMNNFNQAVDGVQKGLPNVKDEASLTGIIDEMVKSIKELAGGLDKDIVSAIGKEKAAGPEAVAKAILLGSKEAQWTGIIGLLDSTQDISGSKQANYKFSKAMYIKEISVTNKDKDLKTKIKVANTFLDNMQKDIQSHIDKEFTEEEVKKIYDKAKGSGGKETDGDYKKGDTVVFLRQGAKKEEYDPNKKPEEQAEISTVGKIKSIVDDEYNIEYGEGKTTKKKKDQIMAKVGGDVEGENAKKAHEVLGNIKTDEDKMGKVVNFAQFIQDANNKAKVDEIEKIMTGGGTPAA